MPCPDQMKVTTEQLEERLPRCCVTSPYCLLEPDIGRKGMGAWLTTEYFSLR